MVIRKNELGSVRHQHPGASIALRLGCYDLLHAGHQVGIDRAASFSDILVVGVMPDEYVRKEKGEGRPINPQEARVSAIDKARGVDYSFITPAASIAVAGMFLRLRPDVYVEDEEYGAPWSRAAFLKAIGVEYVIDSESRISSTTEIIGKLGVAEAVSRSSLDFVLQ